MGLRSRNVNRLRIPLIFICGLVAGLNLATMYPSETYDAGWWKVAFTVLIAVVASAVFREDRVA